MKLASARWWRNSCLALSLLGFCTLGTEVLMQSQQHQHFSPTILARFAFALAGFPLIVAFFPWLATVVYNVHFNTNENYRRAIQKGPTKFIAIDEYKMK